MYLIDYIRCWLSNRTGTSVDDSARKSNNWLDQWQSSKLGTGSRVQSFPRAFPSSSDVLVLLLNQPIRDDATATRTCLEKWICVISIFFLPTYFANVGEPPWSWIPRPHIQVQEKLKFRFVVVQKRQRSVQKNFDARAKLLFCLFNLFFFFLVAVASLYLKTPEKRETKTCNVFCNIAAKRVEKRCGAFYYHLSNLLTTLCCKTGLMWVVNEQ